MNLPLTLHILIHILLSFGAGLIVSLIWKRPVVAFFFALIGGFAVDFDHFIDYYLAFGLNWNWFYFKNGYEFLKSGKVYILLHAWEYVFLLFILTFVFESKKLKTVFLSLALGLVFHLGADVVIDHTPIKTYSIIYRIENNFEKKYLSNPINYEKYLKRKALIEFE